MSYRQNDVQRRSLSQHVRHPAWRKAYLWLFCLAGSGACIAILAASLAPAGANHVQPAGGVFGSLGLAFSVWLGWRAHRVQLRGDAGPRAGAGLADPAAPAQPDPGMVAQLDQAMSLPLDSATDVQVSPIIAARLELQRRQEARDILHRDPALARELRIGRPDLPRTFDDGGLVDVNHAPAAFLAVVPGIDQALAGKIAATREEVGGFSSLADLEVTLELAPGIVNQLQDRLIFTKD